MSVHVPAWYFSHLEGMEPGMTQCVLLLLQCKTGKEGSRKRLSLLCASAMTFSLFTPPVAILTREVSTDPNCMLDLWERKDISPPTILSHLYFPPSARKPGVCVLPPAFRHECVQKELDEAEAGGVVKKARLETLKGEIQDTTVR